MSDRQAPGQEVAIAPNQDFSPQPSTRYHAVDSLRAAMITVVMFGHALLPYVTVPRSFKDPQTHVAFDAAAIFLYGFAMPAFFVTAGFSAALLYERRGVRGLARSRYKAILLPLLAAYLVLPPLTRGAYAFARETASSGSLEAGIEILLLGEWIRWSKAYHLWFLVSLLLYTAMAVGLRWGILKLVGHRAAHIVTASRHLFASRWRPMLVTLVISCTMVPAYLFHDGDATTLPMQLSLFGFFVLGWLLYLHRDLLVTFPDGAWQPIAVAVAIMPLAVWATRQRLMSPDDTVLLVGVVAGFTNAMLAAFMTFGLLGVFQGRFGRPSAIGQYVSDASYWIFLIHFPLLIGVAGLFAVTPFTALTKYLLTLAIVVPIVLATYHYGVRSTFLGRLLKGRKQEPAARPVAGLRADEGTG